MRRRLSPTQGRGSGLHPRPVDRRLSRASRPSTVDPPSGVPHESRFGRSGWPPRSHPSPSLKPQSTVPIQVWKDQNDTRPREREGSDLNERNVLSAIQNRHPTTSPRTLHTHPGPDGENGDTIVPGKVDVFWTTRPDRSDRHPRNPEVGVWTEETEWGQGKRRTDPGPGSLTPGTDSVASKDTLGRSHSTLHTNGRGPGPDGAWTRRERGETTDVGTSCLRAPTARTVLPLPVMGEGVFRSLRPT